MLAYFDYFNQYEIPTFSLCNPDRTKLYAIGGAYDRSLKIKYNALSELSFTVDETISGSVMPYFSKITQKRVIYVDNIGYFSITGVTNTNDGILNKKEVTAQSLEVEFTYKRISKLEGTYKFYDYITPSTSLLGYLLSFVPGWTVGTISSSLLSIYRTFNISDTSIYNLLMTDVENAYQCVFVFDTINKTVSAYSFSEATSSTDIYLSYDNVVQKLQLEEQTDELVTALNVYGSGDLSINTVNPLGTNTIYDFSYFKNTDWMSSSLVTAITSWQAKIAANQTTYANTLTSLKNYSGSLISQQAVLTTYNNDYLALEGVQKVRVSGSVPMSASYVDPYGISWSSLTAAMTSKQNQINSQTATITSTSATITSLTSQLTSINSLLSFSNNFSDSQLIELNSFIYQSTYQNENFVQTSIMSASAIQDQAQALYNAGSVVLSRLSQPRYTLEIDSVNFVFIKDFQTFITQLNLGSIITVEYKTGSLIYPVLLEIDLNYDKPDDFSLVFGNRLRLDNSAFTFSDLFGQTVKQSTNTGFNSLNWGDWNNNWSDPVSTFIESSLDTSRNNLINSQNQDIKINQNGLKVRTALLNSSGSPLKDAYGNILFDPTQLWITNNTIGFTRDNWNTVQLALGKVTTSSGSTYGVVGDVIAGRILAGNQLTITNVRSDGTTANFVLDGNGATITNANLTLNTTNGKTQILLDPTNGIIIKGLTGGTFQNKFYADSSGNLQITGNLNAATGTFAGSLVAATGTFSGAITATSGTIGGWNINSSGIYNGSNYINNNGTAVLGNGALTITGGDAYFTGKIYAANIQNQIQNSQIASISADKVTAGTIYGSTIAGDGWSLYTSGTGLPVLMATNGIQITTNGIRSGLQINNTQLIFAANYALSYWDSSTFNISTSVAINKGLTVSGDGGTTTYFGTETYFGNQTHFSSQSNFNSYAYFNNGMRSSSIDCSGDLDAGGTIYSSVISTSSYKARGYTGENYSAVVSDGVGGWIQLNFTEGILTSHS